MVSINEHRHLTLEKTILLHPENTVNTSIELWERLVRPLLPLIGKLNFECLFSRSLHVTGLRYPWIVPRPPLHASSVAYADLRTCLSGDGGEETGLASLSLLNAFIDILVLLLGERVTQHVLDLAWPEQKAATS